MYSIKKEFGCYPTAHRQPFHKGHCALIHGHNWNYIVELASKTLDTNGFVVDFGDFGEIKDWMNTMFDHTLLLQHNDPRKAELKAALGDTKMAKIVWVESVSAEGLAKLVFERVQQWLNTNFHNGDVRVVSVTVKEDWKNSATYYGK